MDIRQLGNFLTVIELKSLSRAADRLGIGQPALGLQIRALEHELKTTLVTRHSRGVEPTQAGLVLANHIRPILSAVDAARNAAVESDVAKMTVRIGMTSSASVALLSDVTTIVSQKLPQARLKVVADTPIGLLARLRSNEIELACAYANEPFEDVSCETLFDDTLCFVTTDPAYRGRRRIELSEAIAGPLVLAEPTNFIRNRLDISAASLGVSLSLAMIVDSHAMARDVVLAGAGNSILPSRIVTSSRQLGRLSALQIIEPEMPCTLYLIRPLTRETRHLTDVVAEMIRQVCKNAERPLFDEAS